jgi:transposase-like protein
MAEGEISGAIKGRKRGPKPKFTTELCGRFVEARASGDSFSQACAKIGVSRETGRVWRRKYRSFAEADRKGREACLVWWENTMRRMALGEKGNVTAAIFMMKNMFPEDYRDRRDIKMDAEQNVSVKLDTDDFSHLTDEQLEEIIRSGRRA